MSVQRTATPLMASTLALAAGVAAILVGCSRHTTTPQIHQVAVHQPFPKVASQP